MSADLHLGAGPFLRELRDNRDMTLEKAARAVSLSPSVLCRIELSQRGVSRRELTSIANAYHLSQWERTYLFNSAGYLPDSPPQLPHATFRHFAITLMTHLPYPAFMADELLYIHAWNGALNAILHPPQGQPIHMLDDLLTERVQERMGDAWEPYVTRAIWLFFHRSLPHARSERYLALLEWLRSRHGKHFETLWNAALERGYTSRPEERDGGVHAYYETPVGLIEYVVMQAMVAYPSPFDLYMYVPFGRHNRELHRKFEAQVDVYRLYEAVPPAG